MPTFWTFSDEATFMAVWIVAIVVYGELMRQKLMFGFRLQAGNCTGRSFFDNTIHAADYKEMEKYFDPALKSQRRYSRIFFPQDGAPAHYARQVRKFLPISFP